MIVFLNLQNEYEQPPEQVEHPRFFDLRSRFGKKYDEGEPTIRQAHKRSADRDIQAWMREHGLDTSAVDTGEAETSVLGRMREGLDRTAQALGIKTEQPYQPPAFADRAGEGASNLAERLKSAWASIHMRGAAENAAAEDEASSEQPEKYTIGGKEYSYNDLANELAKVCALTKVDLKKQSDIGAT